mgnify:CR=1 FL=1
MSDLFGSKEICRTSKIYVTRDLRNQSVFKNLEDNGFSLTELDDSKISTIENSIIATYPGKGRNLDEKLLSSCFLVIFDADDALERLMSKRCFFINSSDQENIQRDVFESLEEILLMRDLQLHEAKKAKDWDEKVNEALSGFEYLIKALPGHKPGDIGQDEGLADLIDFFVRVLIFKERSVAITAEKQFWETLESTFSDFTFDFQSLVTIPIGQKKWNVSEKEESKYSLLKKMGLAFLVSEFRDQSNIIEKQKREEHLWEDILSNLQFPVALISTTGDLVAQNPAFTQLSIFPVDCLKLRSQQKVESNNSIFRVEKYKIDTSSLDQGEDLFAYIFRDDSGRRAVQGSGEELGIISSSIAHELNNPLAGILASLSLLELEDDITEDTIQAIKDMKVSAKRCKELVEIFLGFSRANPRLAEKSLNEFGAIDKAISLSRFRMIESNLRIDVETQFISKFHRDTNPSILSMVWYLIFSEILTSASHHNLVTGSTSTNLNATFYEKEQVLELIVDTPFDWGDSILKSKLTNHLIELSGLSMTYENKKITLQDWTLV